jgi:regulator of protease activity HflC (stomatin/prohibitin superfamily)
MMVWILIAMAGAILLSSIRKVAPNERGLIVRLGRRTTKTVEPGLTLILPFIDKLEKVSIDPLHVSLPPQSAITKDEIPIQLQASLDAVVRDPALAVRKVRDWRIHLMSYLQDLMKEQFEELDFDNLPEIFPGWVQRIRHQVSQKGEDIGVEITDLQISNLSPRTKPG